MNLTQPSQVGKNQGFLKVGEHRRHEDIGPVVIFEVEGCKGFLVAIELNYHGQPVSVYDVDNLDPTGWSKPRRLTGTITQEDIDKARDLKRLGKSERKIAALVGMSRSKVHRITKSVLKESKEKQVHRKLSSIERAKIRRMLKRGWNQQTIADQMGVCSETVRNIASQERGETDVRAL